MSKQGTQNHSKQLMLLLSRLLLPSEPISASASAGSAALRRQLLALDRKACDEFVALASSNHVIVRGLAVCRELLRQEPDAPQGEWVENTLSAELARIENAVTCLHEICDALTERGYSVAVIKSFDHWPDLGSDLDLYTNADPREICAFMKTRFKAEIAPRSWGDRLAAKWNFVLPGLPELIEIHVGRLGQTGEQVTIAASLLDRTQLIAACGHSFRVPSVADRLMISALQRMYRHFYFRLCDIVDSMTLAEGGCIDYDNLRALASIAGIWEGVATYLVIVSDYAEDHRGSGLDLPQFVIDSARFGGERIYYERSFLRVPILPQSARLYGSQFAGVLGKGELYNTARLSLLPWLATAAIIGQKLTGSDKGIW